MLRPAPRARATSTWDGNECIFSFVHFSLHFSPPFILWLLGDRWCALPRDNPRGHDRACPSKEGNGSLEGRAPSRPSSWARANGGPPGHAPPGADDRSALHFTETLNWGTFGARYPRDTHPRARQSVPLQERQRIPGGTRSVASVFERKDPSVVMAFPNAFGEKARIPASDSNGPFQRRS